MDKKNLQKTTGPESSAAKVGKSFGSMFKRLFIRDKEKMSVLEEEALQTPTQTIIKNFMRNKLGVIGVISFILIMAFSFVGSQFRPINAYYQEPVMANIRPGYNYLKYPSQLVKEGVKDISSGVSFSIGLSQEGNIFLWGQQPVYLREGMSTKVVQVPDGIPTSNIAHIAAGDRHVVIIDNDNNFHGWGYNNFLQSEVPQNVAMKLRNQEVAELVAGEGVTGILFESGEAYVWGSTIVSGLDIVPLEFQGRIEKLRFAALNAIVLLDDGTVGAFGVRGNEISTIPAGIKFDPEREEPRDVKIVDIAASSRAVMALDEQGNIHTWGSSHHDVLDVPEFDGNVVAMSAGKNNHTIVLDTGEIVFWGANHFNQVDGFENIPDKKYVGIHSDFFQNFAVAEDGTISAWGHKGYIFGSDQFGRDNLTRLIHGGRISLTVGAIAVTISTIIALFMGMTSGFFGGWLDNVMMRFTDVVISIPFLPLAITLSTIVVGRVEEMYRLYMIMVILGVLNWPGLARLIRAHLLLEREKDFVLAAKALGVKQKNIIVRHIMPNIFNLVLVAVTLGYANSLLMEAALSFLGFGVAHPTPSWGNMLTGSQSSTVIDYYWWRWIIPGTFVILAALSVNLIGDALRDAMDPKVNEK